MYFRKEPWGGIPAEVWVGPIEVEPALGAMGVSEAQTEGGLGFTLEAMIEKWDVGETVPTEYSDSD